MPTKNLTNESRQEIGFFLLANSTEGKPVHGKLKEAAQKFNVSAKIVKILWDRARVQLEQEGKFNLTTLKKGNCGRKRITLNYEAIKGIEKAKRSTLHQFSAQAGVSYSTAQRWVQRGVIRSHTNAMHPNITAEHKLLRLNFSLSHLVFDTQSRLIKYQSMKQIIHIDEKWFYISKGTQRYYLLPEEEVLYRACKSKRFITKVMFMCAVARLRFGLNGEVLFNGKIGCFPFVEKVPAQRRSKNRPAGTLVTKPIEKVNKQVTKDMLITKIIPTIKERWPSDASRDIIIQQDNAKPHINGSDPDFLAVAHADGFSINLQFQPPNSPDLNVLDLGFFRAIQSLQQQTSAKSVDELIRAVQTAYAKLEASTLNNVFISLQAVMTCVMQRKGHNDFPLPHIGKQAQRRLRNYIEELTVDEMLVKECLHYLYLFGNYSNLQHLITCLGYNFQD